MKIINREMGGGKTYALVELMLAPGNEDVIYVAPTITQAQNIAFRYAQGLQKNADPGRFIGAVEFRTRINSRRSDYNRYVIDELEGVLRMITGARILAVAGTDEDLRLGQIHRRQGGREYV